MRNLSLALFSPIAALLIVREVSCADINSCSQFENIRNNPSGEYFLRVDIDCKGKSMRPIPFSGRLHGGFKKISNIKIDRPKESLVGLFKTISPSFHGPAPLLENVRFENVNVIGADTVGILAGSITESKISDIEVSGSVHGRSHVGGIFGVMERNSFVSGARIVSSVTGKNYVGGIAGTVKFGVISGAYSNARIIGNNVVGGIVSVCSNSSLQFVGSAGRIDGADTVGGIAGIFDGNLDQTIVPQHLRKFVFDELERLDQLVPPYEEQIDWQAATKLPSKFKALNGWFFSAGDIIRIPSSIYQANVSVEINANSFAGGFVGVASDNPLGIAMSASSAFINAKQSSGSVSGSGAFSTVNQAIALSGMCPNCNSGSPMFGSGSGSITDAFVPNHFSPSEILASLYDSAWLDRKITHPSSSFNWLPKSDTDFITGYKKGSDRKTSLISIVPITRNSYDKQAYDFDKLVISKNVKIDRHAAPGSPPAFKTLPIFKSLTDTIDLKQHIWSWENGSSITLYGDTSCLASQKSLLIRRNCESSRVANSYFCIRTERWTGSCFSSAILFE